MIFVELNNGTKINLVHTSSIELHNKEVIYKQAKGSDIVEKFDSESDAQTRYNDLKEDLLDSVVS